MGSMLTTVLLVVALATAMWAATPARIVPHVGVTGGITSEG
ncbi:hypothetical protein [Roseivivax sediminis]|uniref:Uncharacterized protein n=1 Tax=Roseivivax sediminis TaxID=936889 RepID=A0A1I1X0E0_9RHOB|nr:hypothetical protein [Roseivivax sediminis]SFE00058.1 hypothetical protein SAMN04515678_105154 [Roseivivax sediminis]